MADCLCLGDVGDKEIAETSVKEYKDAVACEKINGVSVAKCDHVKNFIIQSDSVKLFDKLCTEGNSASNEGYIDMEITPCGDEDCRKKRCVDRYDSSESSDR